MFVSCAIFPGFGKAQLLKVLWQRIRDQVVAVLKEVNNTITATATIRPGLILIYRKPDDARSWELVRLGSHSELRLYGV
jgi:hypothetical protein